MLDTNTAQQKVKYSISLLLTWADTAFFDFVRHHTFYCGNAFNMILILYIISCKLSCDFRKLTLVYTYIYILSFLWQISQ